MAGSMPLRRARSIRLWGTGRLELASWWYRKAPAGLWGKTACGKLSARRAWSCGMSATGWNTAATMGSRPRSTGRPGSPRGARQHRCRAQDYGHHRDRMDKAAEPDQLSGRVRGRCVGDDADRAVVSEVDGLPIWRNRQGADALANTDRLSGSVGSRRDRNQLRIPSCRIAEDLGGLPVG